MNVGFLKFIFVSSRCRADGQSISRETIEESIDNGEAYRIVVYGNKVGGVVIKVDGDKGDLDLLFVSPDVHSKALAMLHGVRLKNCTQK